MNRWYWMTVCFADGATYKSIVNEEVKTRFKLSQYETFRDWITLYERDHGVVINSERVNYIHFELIEKLEENAAANPVEKVG
jgi:hypothetical protein